MRSDQADSIDPRLTIDNQRRLAMAVSEASMLDRPLEPRDAVEVIFFLLRGAEADEVQAEYGSALAA